MDDEAGVWEVVVDTGVCEWGIGEDSPSQRCRLLGGPVVELSGVATRLPRATGLSPLGGEGERVDGMRTILRFSRMGRPQPHFRHFWPICCSQMPRHNMSSSASDFQSRLTWAARHREVASRWPRTLSETS